MGGAPDGSLLIADCYDPSVSAHNMQDLDNGRLYQVAPENHKYGTTAPDLSAVNGAAAALRSPNMSTRYLAWTALNTTQGAANSTLARLATPIR
jgi:hypothetical protein